MLAEKFVVTVDELSLTYGRKQLALVYTIELFLWMHFTAPGSNSSRRNQNDFHPGFM